MSLSCQDNKQHVYFQVAARPAAAGRTRTTTTVRLPRGRSLAWRARTTRSTRCRRSPAGSAAFRSRPRTSSRRITLAGAAVATTGVRCGQFVSLILQKVWLSGLHENTYALILSSRSSQSRKAADAGTPTK